MSEMRDSPRLLVIGHYGGANTGDEAMLIGLLQGIREAGSEAEITVASKFRHPPEWVKEFGARLIALEPAEILKAVAWADVVICGGGTHFHDDYRGRRYLRHLVSMGRVMGPFLIARLLGKKVAWLSVGLGPFYRRLSRLESFVATRTAHLLVARDRRSEALARAWLPDDRVHFAFDLAGLAPSETSHRPPGTRMLGISVKEASDSHSVGEADEGLQSRLTQALQELLDADPELEIRIFPFRGGEVESDVPPSRALLEELERIAPERVRLVPYRVDPRHFLREIGECTHFIATRYHAAVLAYLAGCQLAVVPYHQKVTDFLEVIGAREDCILPYDSDLDEMRSRLGRILEREVDSPTAPGTPSPEEAARDARRNIELLLGLMDRSSHSKLRRETAHR